MKAILGTAVATALLAMATGAQAVTPGDFDPAYGDTAPGYTITPHADSAEAQDLVLLDDGSTVTAGITDVGGTFLPLLTKFKPSGAVDGGFGVGGFAGPAATPDPINQYVQLTRYRDQLYLLVPAATRLYVYNYDINGVLNPAFGVGGVATIEAFSANAVVDVAMWRNRILIAGRFRTAATGEHDFLLARLLPNGAMDASFGVGGLAVHSLSGGSPLSREAFTGLAVLPDLRIVAGGRTTKDASVANSQDFVIGRFRADGSVDATFGTTAPGFTQVDFGYDDFGRRVAVYANLQVVIAGSVCKTDPVTFEQYCVIGTSRVDNTGALDPSWNGSGTQLTDLGGDGLTVTDVALDRRERAIVSTYWYRAQSVAHYAGLTRYDFLGGLDPAFQSGGTGLYTFGGLPMNGYHTVKLVNSKFVATCGAAGKETAPGVFTYGEVVARHYNY